MGGGHQQRLKLLLGICLCVCLGIAAAIVLRRGEQQDSGINKVYARGRIEQQARELAEHGQFDEAIILYRQAIQPEYINQEHEKSTAVGALIDIYTIQNNYEEALKSLAWFLRHNPPAESALEQKEELEALIEFRDRGDESLTESHVGLLKERYKKWLPPVGYNTYSPIVISKILRLYNTVGDHDAGIAFVDQCLEYIYKQYPKMNKVHSAQEAYQYVIEPGEKTTHRLDWLEYKGVWDHLKIREAFEQDKADGFKGCAHSPPGQVCMGKATKALIQSDYFPW